MLRIVAAAIKFGDRVWTGDRHWLIMAAMRDELGDECPRPITQEMQGFVDQDGTFWSRFQSGAIAYRAGQTPKRIRTLLSEHLW
jgi:hypothetical protein